LQISSIEGEGSYFYDKKTDAVYDVDWGDMDDFMAGRLKPIFTSFYDFLEWYYSCDNIYHILCFSNRFNLSLLIAGLSLSHSFLFTGLLGFFFFP
jgi:hypothetical protein